MGLGLASPPDDRRTTPRLAAQSDGLLVVLVVVFGPVVLPYAKVNATFFEFDFDEALIAE